MVSRGVRTTRRCSATATNLSTSSHSPLAPLASSSTARAPEGQTLRCCQQCISKGKARTRYEFGVKVPVATTLKEGFVVGTRSMPGNPYDGHTPEEAIEQVSILAEQTPKIVIVDTRAQNSRAFESCDQDRSAALAECCTR